MPEQLPVIFRADREDGQLWVTAVFPSLSGTNDPATFTIYQHVGQHGSADRGWYNRTRAATEEEYRDLLEELRAIYAPEYILVRAQRMTARHDAMRSHEIEAMRQGGMV